ncbi:MAG: hypothetical protein V1752_02300 [Candidatus Firestonebacteria bacterium]
MDILSDKIKKEIQKDVVDPILKKNYDAALDNIPGVIKKLYASIPENKRISYGVVYAIKVFSEYLHNALINLNLPVYRVGLDFFNKSSDFRGVGVALWILSFYGLDNLKKVLPCFESAAAYDDWIVREITQMFFRKLIKKHPDETQRYLLKLVKSKDKNIRRFVGETLRPVQENKWFYKNPEYSLCVLRKMFKESSAYPRTSVGNNLSDLAKRLPEYVYGLIGELVDSGNKNSYWIAYRACRNLVKKEPEKVMSLLKIKEYKYKDKVYRI